ncbi:MAG: HAD family hydrolase [Synechococcaceae cyanobacterium]|nr:HAD family hydrolase [Synechococcaceae cyanobacterium]
MAQLLLRGTALAEVDAVLFDKDGTLCHSEPMLLALAQARISAILALHDPEGTDPDGCAQLELLLRRAYGLGEAGLHPAGTIAVAARDHNLISSATALAQVGHGWPEAVSLSEEAFRRTDGLHGRGARRAPWPTDGLNALLSTLSAAGVRCAVISNDHVAGIEAFLRDHGLRELFQALWSAEHIPRKPDPGAVVHLCADLGIPPRRCALIGDANSDLRMAEAAGVAAALGYRGGWSRGVSLDPRFPQLQHWRELALAPGGPVQDVPLTTSSGPGGR